MKRIAAILLTAAVILTMTISASASWMQSGTGKGYARATSMPAGFTPTAAPSGSSVTVTWTQNTMGGTRIGALTGGGYTLKRYANGGTTPITPNAACAGTVSGTAASLSCTETSVPDGAWQYTITPALGNWRGAASGKSTAITVDTVSPTVTLTTPANNTYTSNTTPTFSGAAGTAAGDSSTITVRVYSGATTGGSLVQTRTATASAGTWSVLASPALAQGTYTAQASQSDGSGNTGTSSANTFTVDTTAPVAPTITSSPATPTNSTTASFSFTHPEGSGVTFLCQLDGGGFSACTSPKSYTGLSQAVHTFDVKAQDLALNQGPAASASWAVDLTAPTSAITFPAAGGSYNVSTWNAGCTSAVCGTAADSGGASLANVKISILQSSTGKYWNGSSFGPTTEQLLPVSGTASWSYAFAGGNFPAQGSYTIRSVATDTAGNVQSATTSATFTFDTQAPTISDVTISNGGSTAGKPEAGDQIKITFSEAISASSICSTWANNGLAQATTGNNQAQVSINDNAVGGNDQVTFQIGSGQCGGAIHIGSINLGSPAYVSASMTFGANGQNTVFAYDPTTRVLTVTLGKASSTTAACTSGCPASSTVTYTPDPVIADLAGNAISGTGSKTGQQF